MIAEALAAALIALQLVDAASTYYGQRDNLASEANPRLNSLARRLREFTSARWGWLAWSKLAVMALVAWGWSRGELAQPWVPYALAPIVGYYLYVCGNNIKLIRQQKAL